MIYITLFHLFHVSPLYTIRALNLLDSLNMFSHSLFAELSRWTIALVLSLVALHHCQPLLDAFSEHAMAAGCHSQEQSEMHMHHEHHHHYHHNH